MQNYTRFDRIRRIFLNKDNYTFELQKDLEKFIGWNKCVSTLNGGIRDFEELEYLLIDDIVDDVKERFERQVQTISIVPDSRKTAVKIETPLGKWGYLIAIQKDSFSFHTIEDNGLWTEPEERNMRMVTTYTFNLLFDEKEIIFCMMQNLCKVVDYDRKFNELFSEYKGMFDGSLEDFLDCLITTEASFVIYNQRESIKDFPYYPALRAKLTNMINNLPATDNVEEGEPKDSLIVDEVTGRDCPEFDNLFGNDLKAKNEIWAYMKHLQMIDDNGNYKVGNNIQFIRAFIVVMVKYFKIPNRRITTLIRIFTLKIFGKSKRIHDFLVVDEKRIEDFFNGNQD